MFPMTRSADCLGAICSLLPSEDNPIALFNSRQEAQTAIRISKLYYHLRKSQGLNVDDDEPDFNEHGLKQLYIQPAASS